MFRILVVQYRLLGIYSLSLPNVGFSPERCPISLMLSGYKSFTPNSLSSSPEVMEIASSRSSEGHLEGVLQKVDEKLCSLLKVEKFYSS